jgi:hypothetical protein
MANLLKQCPRETRPGVVSRDARVLASGYFAQTKFLVVRFNPYCLPRQFLSGAVKIGQGLIGDPVPGGSAIGAMDTRKMFSI